MLSQFEDKQTLTNFILEELDDVIVKNPDRPSETHLIEFTIDTEKAQFSQWGSQVHPVEKPDGSMRVCGNNIVVNLVTEPNKYPFSNVHYFLQSLGQAKAFSKLDLAQDYFQIPIKEEHKEEKCSCRTVEKHKQHLYQVLTQLKAAKLSIKLSKSQFILDPVEYLGFVVYEHDTSASPDKIKPILSYQAPINLTELERFLGVTGAYQMFISQYQPKTEPHKRLKKKKIPSVWDQEQEKAFEARKQDLYLLRTLKQFEFS
ncbi:hypothetical protein G6F37_009727 [Rhizopus arrhizus]|nr:hypothetical protein G6F38_009761 [Rhizopus arrhizus]KAG1154138.1 hypothetical protein G6F37_009727 [Rhizopus arrhizus]